MPSTNPAKRSYDQLISAIEEDIFSRRLSPGDRLPSERKLQEIYSLSRSMVREAWRVLEQRGLIEIRKGARGGAFVAALKAERVNKTLTDFMRLAQIPARQIMEYREAVESVAAGLAAERATGEDLARLKDLLARARAVIEARPLDLEEFYRLERLLHLELARISGNTLIDWFNGAIALHFWEVVQPPRPDQAEEPLRSLEDWAEIIRAMENREILQAQSIIRGHLSRHSTYLRQSQRREKS